MVPACISPQVFSQRPRVKGEKAKAPQYFKLTAVWLETLSGWSQGYPSLLDVPFVVLGILVEMKQLKKQERPLRGFHRHVYFSHA